MGIFKKKGGIDPPVPTPPASHSIGVITGIPNATIDLLDDKPATFAMKQTAGQDGTTTFHNIPNTTKQLRLMITSNGVVIFNNDIVDPKVSRDVNIVFGPAGPSDISLSSLTSPFPPESGRLFTVGRAIYEANGKPWRCRGVSMFLLALRYYLGKDITPEIDWMLRRGFNEPRIFMNANWADDPNTNVEGFTHEELALWKRPWELPNFDPKMHELLNLLASRGLRAELTVHTYAFDMSEMRAYTQRNYDIGQSHWNVRIQGANEAENNGIDVLAIYQGVNRYGILSNYGNDPERHCDGQPDADAWGACMRREVPNLDTGASHDLRRDLNSARNPKDGWEFQNLFGIPWFWQEPLGAIDPGDPIMIDDGDGFWHHFPRGGIRTTNMDVLVCGQIVADFLTWGYTFHPECGVRGRAPKPTETVQDGIAEMMCKVHAWLPTNLPLGQYTRPGLSGFAVKWADNDTDSRVGHAYGIITGDTQHVVICMPSSSWKGFEVVEGWRLDEIGPVPYLARFVRA